jgi:nicotinic acetylcholine receptor
VPDWVDKYINGYLARLLRMESPGSKDEEDEEDKKSNLNGFGDMHAKSLLANVLDINDDFGLTNKPKKSKLILKSEGSSTCENCTDNSKSLDPSCRKLMSNILKELQVLTKKIADDAEDEEKELSWKFAAMVIDRLCMWIFAISTFIATVGILFTAKNFFKFQ